MHGLIDQIMKNDTSISFRPPLKFRGACADDILQCIRGNYYRHPLLAPLRSNGGRICFPSVYLFIYFIFYSPFVLRNYSTDFCNIFRNCVFWYSLNNPVVLNLFWRHLAEINAKNSQNLLKISRV